MTTTNKNNLPGLSNNVTIEPLKGQVEHDKLHIIYHGPDFISRKPQHFASIIARRSDESYLDRDCAAVQVASDGADLYFTNGRFRLTYESRSILAGPISIPVLTKKLRSLEDIEEEVVAAEYVPLRTDSPNDRDYYFTRDGKGSACEMLQLLWFWNLFEDQGLSWDRRENLITGETSGQNSLELFQTDCARAGLKLGEKTPHQKQFDDMEQILRKFELMFWHEIEDMAEVASRNLGCLDRAKK